MSTRAPDLKARRVEAKISRKTAAEVCGISQFQLDRIERGVNAAEETRKAYDTGLAKLLAEAAKNKSTNGTKPAATKKATSKPRARTRRAAQLKSKTEETAA